MVSVVAASAPAGASPVDVLGLGSRRAGQANAGIAAADDASAVYDNPAGLLGRPACRRANDRRPARTHEKPRQEGDDDERGGDDSRRADKREDDERHAGGDKRDGDKREDDERHAGGDKRDGRGDERHAGDDKRGDKRLAGDDKRGDKRLAGDDKRGGDKGGGDDSRRADTRDDDKRKREQHPGDDDRRGEDRGDDDDRRGERSSDRERGDRPDAGDDGHDSAERDANNGRQDDDNRVGDEGRRGRDGNGRRDEDGPDDDTCDAAARTGELVLGMVGEYSHLSINGIRAPLADAGAAQLAVRVRLASRFALGFAMSAPSSHLSEAVVRAPDQPYYPYYRDRLSRAVLLAGAGVKLTDRVSVGGALDLTPGFTKSRAIAGVATRLSSSLRAGIAYHQRFALVDEATNVRVHYTPHTVLAGVAYTTDAIVASLDGGWAHWSGFRGPYPLGVETPAYKDTFSVRFGAESTATSGILFRAGYAFESSAIPATQPVTNLLDGTKHTVAGGAGYAAGRLRIDAHVLITIVTTRTLERMDQPKLKSGGELFGAGMSVTSGF